MFKPRILLPMSFLALLACGTAFAAGPAATQALRGTVFAADGKPAAGAVVWAAKLDYDNRLLQRRETVTEANGKYLLDLDAGEWFVWGRLGSQGGEGPARHEVVKIDTGQPPAPVTIVLEERGRFHGRLLEAETGKPIAGAKLFLDAGLILTTDAKGKFEMGGMARGNHEAFVFAPGRLRMRVLFDTTARAETELEVSVPRGAKLAGRVTGLDGKPIANAFVGRSTSGTYFSINALYTACGPDGSFEYHGVLPDQSTYRLSASAPGYVTEDHDGPAIDADGKPVALVFRLRKKPRDVAKAPGPQGEKRRVVSGIVLDRKGKPVGGVLVRWGWQGYVGSIEMPTDAEGRFRLIVPDSDGMLAVLPRDYAPDYRQVAKGGDKKLDVTLDPGEVARGQVIDDLGRPIKDVRVIAVTPSPEPGIGNPNWLTESAVRTNAEGRFELKGIPAQARFDFVKPGLSEVRNFGLDLGSNDNAVTMTYGGAIKGRLLDRDGKPIPNFRVLLDLPRDRKPGDVTAGFFAGYSGIGVRFTSPDGSFVLSDVGAGSVYRLTAVAPGHGEAVVDRVLAVPRNRLEKAEATEFRATLPISLRVRAVTSEGKPVAGARVTLVNGQEILDRSFTWGYDNAGWDDIVRGRTAADGWADFPTLSFGAATIAIEAPGYGRQRLAWRSKQQELTATLTKEAVLACRAYDEVGAPLKAFYVRLQSKAGDSLTVFAGPNSDGKARFNELSASDWTVTILDASGNKTLHEERITLAAGATKELNIVTK